ncbi:MAG: GIY-YIG nuclease family protein [Patescibacteria group bacterium]
MYTVYVLRSLKDGNLYVGCTSNLKRRLSSHNSGRVRSTKGRRPLTLIYHEEYEDRVTAFRTECFYKTAKGKGELKKKIENHCRIV